MDPEPDPNIERVLIVRDIHLGLAAENLHQPVHQLWELLAQHEERNRVIAEDIAEALREGWRGVPSGR